MDVADDDDGEGGLAEFVGMFLGDTCDPCSSCPFVLDSRFNASVLRGMTLIQDVQSCEEGFMCGLNRLARTFGHTGLVGLASTQFTSPSPMVR